MSNKVVIIGGGLGGLFSGALLAKNGCTVCVLEKNHIIGGGLQCFHRGKDIYETGMHVIGGFQEGGNLNRICKYLGIMDKLAIKPTDDDAIDTIYILDKQKEYAIPHHREQFTKYLISQFPEEEEGIKAYVKSIYDMADSINLYNLRRSESFYNPLQKELVLPVNVFIAQFIKNEDLRALLSYMNPLYGGIKDHTPTYIHAMINVLYIEGSSFFEGGSQQLADALADIITTNGGEVLAGKEVVRVEVNDRMVQKVITKDGAEYSGDYYISDIHPSLLFAITDEGAFSKAYTKRLNALPNSYSALLTYIKFKPDTEPYVNHPRYILRSLDHIWELSKYDPEAWPLGFMYVTLPEENQGEYCVSMKVNCVIPFDTVKKWEDTTVGHRGKEYEEWKKSMSEKVIDVLDTVYPGFRSRIDSYFTATPLTIRDYYGTKEGSIYGFLTDAEDLAASQVPVVTKVRNLLLTGQNVNLHGICGVPLTAIQTAEAILGLNTIIDQINEGEK